MKTQTDKKVPLPLKVHESVFNEVDQAAKEKGVPRSDAKSPTNWSGMLSRLHILI